jgi:hypothetical protein
MRRRVGCGAEGAGPLPPRLPRAGRVDPAGMRRYWTSNALVIGRSSFITGVSTSVFASPKS